jgi:streptomycin 6-kinase
MNGLPPGFIHTVRETFGHARADTWFKNLQSIISDCERHWNFKAGHPFPNLSYNYAAPAMCSDGSETVLKIGIPNPELRTEIAALRLCNGEGMARLLEADDERGILLLERLHPGTTLVEVAEEDDEKATSIAAGVMRQLWHDLPQQHSFPSTSD